MSTLLQAKQLCAGSTEVGLTIDDPRLVDRINEAQRRLIHFRNLLVRREEYDLPHITYAPISANSDVLLLDELDATKLQSLALWREENNLGGEASGIQQMARSIVTENLTAEVESAAKTARQAAALGTKYTRRWYLAKLGLDIPTIWPSSDAKIFRLVDRAAAWIYQRIYEYQLVDRNRIHSGVPTLATVPADETTPLNPVIEYEVMRLIVQAFLSEGAVQGDVGSQAAGSQMLFTLLTGEAYQLLTRRLDAELQELRHTTYTAALTASLDSTLGRAKAQFALEIPGALELSNAELVRLVNSAEQRLMEGGKWKGMIKDVEISIDAAGVVSMPQEVETVLAAAVNRRPTLIKGIWYEFIPGGPGLQDETCSWVRRVLIDRGLDETTGLRNYFIASCNDGDTLSCRCKRRFVYKSNDSDKLQLRNISALKNAVQGIICEGYISEQTKNPQMAAFYWSVAGKILSNEMDEFLGDSADRAMPVQMESFAANEIDNIL